MNDSMSRSTERIDSSIDHYLRTGRDEIDVDVWPGDSLAERLSNRSDILREALIREVLARSARQPAAIITEQDSIRSRTKSSVEPMVRGLFPATEQDIVLRMLEQSVVVLVPTNIESILRTTPFLTSAWKLASLYLSSMGSAPLAEDGSLIVGFSEGTTCYVSVQRFQDDCPYSDYITHEAAHVFHSCKRKTLGLPRRKRCEWLLDIDFRHRETFAYACETYSRIVVAGSRSERRTMFARYTEGAMPADERVDIDEYLDILAEAVSARNGWKRILRRCSSGDASSIGSPKHR